MNVGVGGLGAQRESSIAGEQPGLPARCAQTMLGRTGSGRRTAGLCMGTGTGLISRTNVLPRGCWAGLRQHTHQHLWAGVVRAQVLWWR